MERLSDESLVLLMIIYRFDDVLFERLFSVLFNRYRKTVTIMTKRFVRSNSIAKRVGYKVVEGELIFSIYYAAEHYDITRNYKFSTYFSSTAWGFYSSLLKEQDRYEKTFCPDGTGISFDSISFIGGLLNSEIYGEEDKMIKDCCYSLEESSGKKTPLSIEELNEIINNNDNVDDIKDAVKTFIKENKNNEELRRTIRKLKTYLGLLEKNYTPRKK